MSGVRKFGIVVLSVFYLAILCFSPSVVADLGAVTICSFNDENTGVTSGSISLGTYEASYEGDFSIYEQEWLDNTKVLSISPVYPATGVSYINFTEDISLEDRLLSVQVKPSGTTSGDAYMKLFLYDDDEALVEFWVGSYDDCGVSTKMYRDGSGDLNVLGTNAGNPADWELYINMSFLGGNNVNYTEGSNYAVSSGCTTNDIKQFNRIELQYVFTYTVSYRISVGEISLSAVPEGDADIDTVSVYTDGEAGLSDVQTGSTHRYGVTIYGDKGAEYLITLSRPSGSGYVAVYNKAGFLPSAEISFMFDITYQDYWSTGEYVLTVSNWLFIPSDDSYNETGTFNVYSLFQGDYYETYYNGSVGLFAEFDTIEQQDLGTGDYVPIVYYLPENPTQTTAYVDGWWYAIALFKDNMYTGVYTAVSGDNTTHVVGRALDKFGGLGVYQLKVYNLSVGYDSNVSNFYPDSSSLEYVSYTITIDTYGSTDPDSEDSEDADDSFVGLSYAVWGGLVGIGLVALGSIAPNLILANSRQSINPLINLMIGFSVFVGCTMFGFFPLWVAFIFALLCAVILVIKLKGMR